jgi:hypothetical protein
MYTPVARLNSCILRCNVDRFGDALVAQSSSSVHAFDTVVQTKQRADLTEIDALFCLIGVVLLGQAAEQRTAWSARQRQGRLARCRARGTGGAGLGLAIVKQPVKRIAAQLNPGVRLAKAPRLWFGCRAPAASTHQISLSALVKPGCVSANDVDSTCCIIRTAQWAQLGARQNRTAMVRIHG